MQFFISGVAVLITLNLPLAFAERRPKTVKLKDNCEIILSENTEEGNRPFVFYSENGKSAVFQYPGKDDLHQYIMQDLETGSIIGSGLDRPHDYQTATIDDHGKKALFLQSKFENNAWNERLSILDFVKGAKMTINLTNIKTGNSLVEQGLKIVFDPSRFSDLTLNHPFLFRRRSASKNNRLVQAVANYSEIINWQTMQGFRLKDVAENLDEVVPGLNVIHPVFQFAAMPSKDLRTVNIISQEDLIRKTKDTSDMAIPKKFLSMAVDHIGRQKKQNPKYQQRYQYGLKHANAIRRMMLARWAPYVFTQTSDGVAIWNAREGSLVGGIPDAHSGFEVLPRMRVVAYDLPGNRLGLYSVRERKTVYVIENSSGLGSETIDHWQNYVAYITDRDGEIFRLNEYDNKKAATYSLEKLGIKKPLNAQLTTVDVKNQTYLVVIRPDVALSQISLTAYSMTTKTRVLEKVYAFDGLGGGSVFDPHRRRMLYTANSGEIQLLDLAKTLAGENLGQIQNYLLEKPR